jgi:alpha-L-arabinofuranosidase
MAASKLRLMTKRCAIRWLRFRCSRLNSPPSMRHCIGIACLFVLCSSIAALAQPVTLQVDTSAPGKAISPDLVGIFFEDLSHAADGGLYAELVQNRDFEYSSADNPGWHALTSWQVVHLDGARGTLTAEFNQPLHANTPHYALLTIESPNGQVGLRNEGFDGIALQAGENYDFSLFARRISGASRPIYVRLESKTGTLLGEAVLPAPSGSWAKYTARISVQTTDPDVRLVVSSSGPGQLALDHISLFPEKTFRNRPNGLRADLAQIIADLKPKFMRFPGGCLVHGDGLDNIYHWKNTIGPIEQRKGQPNIWRYHQSVGLGYFEYFQFCEDIGAKPVPVVAAGVCCQNSNFLVTRKYGIGQEGLPMDQMPAYIQDVLDLIEWANGPATSKWGAKRAAAGHPEPFGLKYLGVGNEDKITPVFKERFQMIYEAVKAKHPEIVVIGTVGPNPAGDDYENGWKIADELRLPMVDEHCYKSPQWFWENLLRYDAYDRARSKVYLGEWAAFDDKRRSTLRSAIAEAAYLTALERNADVVRFSSYAPMLAKRDHTHWNPNLIYFTNTEVFPTISYHVQQLFSVNNGDTYLPTTVSVPADSADRRTLILGTWNTQAEFDDIRLTRGPQTLLVENFNSATSAWKPDSGTWQKSAGSYRQSSSLQPALSRLELPLDGPAFTLTLKARKTGGAEGLLVGVGATPDNYYCWNLGGWANTQHGVERSVGGARSLVGRAVPGRIESNRWYDIKIESDGKRVRFHLNGTLVHDIAGSLESVPPTFAASCVKDTASGDLILKLVNGAGSSRPVGVELAGAKALPTTAEATVLAGQNPMSVNDYGSPRTVLHRTSRLSISAAFDYEAPANSLTVIRIAP